ncbi:hypothetical protein [Nocardia sp. CA-290969]|uniref:hypothetical protein n=1 Tax=Nocardia sp. CA-290969 TaxID=3239986 RepID=UPI003D8D1285
MEDFLAVLREEFEAAEGSFMLGLRGEGLVWDRAGFTRLERAMRRACEWSQEHDRFDRWMAEGFYEASHFVRDWTSHPNFPRPEPAQYHLDCLERIDDLADWYFRGFHAYQEPHVWRDL